MVGDGMSTVKEAERGSPVNGLRREAYGRFPGCHGFERHPSSGPSIGAAEGLTAGTAPAKRTHRAGTQISAEADRPRLKHTAGMASTIQPSGQGLPTGYLALCEDHLTNSDANNPTSTLSTSGLEDLNSFIAPAS